MEHPFDSIIENNMNRKFIGKNYQQNIDEIPEFFIFYGRVSLLIYNSKRYTFLYEFGIQHHALDLLPRGIQDRHIKHYMDQFLYILLFHVLCRMNLTTC